VLPTISGGDVRSVIYANRFVSVSDFTYQPYVGTNNVYPGVPESCQIAYFPASVPPVIKYVYPLIAFIGRYAESEYSPA
jgi:hypothetical protein